MNDGAITLKLTTEQAFFTLAALCGHRKVLAQLQQEMITNLSPQESIRTVAREAKLMADVGRIIKEALLTA